MSGLSSLPRLKPVEPPYEPELQAQLKKWMPPNAPFEPLLLFRTLARNEQLFSRMRPIGAAILGPASSIAPAERELVIDRVCARCSCEYEWGVHVAAFGQLPGLHKARMSASANPTDPTWTERESLLLQMVDELHDTACISDELWGKLVGHWNEAQLIELLVIVGWYHLISFVANATDLTLEPWAARFPAPKATK
jgi:4-carboxymuconolactone decarboxylase